MNEEKVVRSEPVQKPKRGFKAVGCMLCVLAILAMSLVCCFADGAAAGSAGSDAVSAVQTVFTDVTGRSDKIHIAEGYIIVNGKGNKERFVPVGLTCRKALLKYCAHLPKREPETPLFVKDDLTPIKQNTVKQMFRKLKVSADIPRLHPHLLRHTFATRYLEAGGDIYSLQSILGHTSLEMVKKYVHLIPSKTVVNFDVFSPLDNALKK